MPGKYFIPDHYLAYHKRISSKGKWYWLVQHQREFCKLYLGIDYKTFRKELLHNYLYEMVGEPDYTNKGLPIWKYSDEPIKLEISEKIIKLKL